MKTKRTKKLLAFLITTAMAVMMMSSVVSAAPGDANENNYTPIQGTSTTFTKYLVVPNDTNIPALTFTYTIAGGTAVDGDANNLPIYSGTDTNRVTGTPTVGPASFTAGQTTEDGKANDGIANDTDHRYASSIVTVDFSSVYYSEPGVYRYIITEVNDPSIAPSNVTYDSQLVRTLDVNVVNDTREGYEGKLQVASYVMYYGTVTGSQSKQNVQDTNKKAQAKDNPATTDVDESIKSGDKCDNYINKFPSQSLYVGKKIDGNQASKDKYFKFTVALSNAGAGTIINVAGDFTNTKIEKNVNGATTDLPTGGYTNPPTITVGADGTVSVDYYLQGDQYIQLQGVPTGATYTVSEATETYVKDGYVCDDTVTKSFTMDGLTGVTFDDKLSDTVAAGTDYATGYTNTKDGTIPTGIIISVAGLLIVGIIAVIGFVFFGVHSKRRYEED